MPVAKAMIHNSCILDDPAISGKYLFPQDRLADDPFIVPVNDVELACYRRIIDPDQFTMIHFHGNGEAVADYLPYLADWFAEMRLNSLFVEYRDYGASTGKAQLVAMPGDGEAALKAAQEKLNQLRHELAPFANSDADYRRLIEEKEKILSSTGDARLGKLLGITEQLADLTADRKELLTCVPLAVHQCERRLKEVNQAIEGLNNSRLEFIERC